MKKVHWQRNGQKTDSSGVVLHEYCFVEEGRYYSPRTVVNAIFFSPPLNTLFWGETSLFCLPSPPHSAGQTNDND